MATNSVKLFLCISYILFLNPISARAQNAVTDLNEKFRLEKVISERLEQTLQTRLEKEYFDIAVEVKVRPTPSTNTRGPASADDHKTYETEAVSITLGLSDQVKDAYKESLKNWLNKWSQTSFAEKGAVNIVVRNSNKTDKVIEAPKTASFDLSRYQNLIGLFFVGLVFGASFLYQFVRNRKNTTQPTEHTHEHPLLTLNTISPTNMLPAPIDFQTPIESLKTKIALIAPSLPSQVEHMVQKWSYGEHENSLKLIALIEALAEKNSTLNRDNKSTIPNLPPHMHARLAQGLLELQNMDPQYQLSLYQEIYTELLIGSPMAVETMNHEYKFIEDLADTDFKNLISSLEDNHKVALLNRLTHDQRRQFCTLVGNEEFSRLLSHSLLCKEPDEKEFIEKINDWHKAQKNNFDVHLDVKFAKIEEIISSFSRVEEARFLQQVSVTQPDIRSYMERKKSQIAFMPFWDAEMIKKFCHATKARQLAAAALCLPFLRDSFLKGCGPTTRMTLEVELLNLKDPAKINKAFDEFVTSFDAFSRTYRLNQQTMESFESHNINSKLVS